MDLSTFKAIFSEAYVHIFDITNKTYHGAPKASYIFSGFVKDIPEHLMHTEIESIETGVGGKRIIEVIDPKELDEDEG